MSTAAGTVARTPAGTGPPALLRELLDGGLDPGYAAAAASRPPGNSSAPRLFRVLTVAVALVAGLVLALGWNDAHQSAPAQAVLHAELVARARAAQVTTRQLAAAVQQQASTVAAAQAAALSGDADGQQVQAELAVAKVAAGTLAVRGPGLQVDLGNPPAPAPEATAGGRVGTTPIAAVAAITDQDVRSVVNALWAAGAQAVAVDQVRVTPLSAIRFAGEEVLVDFQSVSSPYTIRAIGNPDVLAVAFAQSPAAGRYAGQAASLGVVFTFAPAVDLQLPAGVLADPSYASAAAPLPAATPTTGSPR